MRVILKENMERLGRKGDIVDVAAGYGRNYLLPKKLAIEVTGSNMKMIEMEQQVLRKKFEQEKLSYQELIEKINEIRLTFYRKAREKDVIFGSVSSSDIKDALEKLGIEVDKKKILLGDSIKRLGNFVVPIKIFHEERAEVKIEVVKEGEISSKEDKEEKKLISKEAEKKEAVAEEPKKEGGEEGKRE